MSPQITVADVLEPYDERLGDASEPIILTLTEGNGFIPQQERFNKRLATEDTSDYKVIRRGDYAFNPYLLWAGAIACNRTHDVGIISPAYPTFRVRGGYEAAYVERLFSSEAMKVRYDLISFGAVPRRRRAKTEDFLAISLPSLPPLPEQKRIAAILDAADALRTKRRESIEQLDSLVQATFLEMFGDPEQGWLVTTVDQIASATPSSIRTGPFGSQLLHSEFTEEGVRVLGIDNAVGNEFRDGAPRFISLAKYEQLHRYTVSPGDVLITIMGTCGRCAIVPEGIGTAINTKHLCCITLDRRKCLPQFLHAYFLRHPVAQRYLRSQTKGAIMEGLNMGIIKAIPVSLPPLTVQTRFASIVESIEQQKARLKAHLAELDTLFASLQSRAFNGELVA